MWYKFGLIVELLVKAILLIPGTCAVAVVLFMMFLGPVIRWILGIIVIFIAVKVLCDWINETIDQWDRYDNYANR